ncbi:hypothetical protein [Candidatus Nanohalobium constans]|uniref:Uncharacterized protein n=1 Tax=Candidatus Nanohalobium constans TaxID=2565781 RepID=A0A5Q0UJ93_9ARCH|nr:hypothetical protein [Candidatus Nanohalobium constans]QGA80899.1 hypothetical protein LC1Nh_1025 [Candidatus Nanohalobium constans]
MRKELGILTCLLAVTVDPVAGAGSSGEAVSGFMVLIGLLSPFIASAVTSLFYNYLKDCS